MKRLLLQKIAFFVLPVTFLFFHSCNVLNPNIMLHAKKDFVFDSLKNDTNIAKEFVLGPNDIIEFRLFANDGFKLIDIISSGANSFIRQGFEYPIDIDGNVRLPIIGNEHLAGLTVREAERQLQKRFSEYYVDPFVLLKVLNKKIIVYNGEPGNAKVITLTNHNTTVIEALALAGGISANGKAYNIKLIRVSEDPKKPTKVYKLDLSDLKTGIEQGTTILQSGDIIYVEPRRQVATKALREISPVMALTTTIISFYFLITRL